MDSLQRPFHYIAVEARPWISRHILLFNMGVITYQRSKTHADIPKIC